MVTSSTEINCYAGKQNSESQLNETCKLDYERRDIYIHINSDAEKTMRANACRKEPHTVSWIEDLFKPGDVIFDIGANNGSYSLVAAAHLKGDCEVYSIEPAWFNFMQLNRNVRLNGFQSCIYPICLAFSNSSGIQWFHYSSEEIGSAFHTVGNPIDVFGQQFKPVASSPLATMTIDFFVKQLQKHPNHIKIDVDGVEGLIIEGAQETLNSELLQSIQIELNMKNDDNRQVAKDLMQYGFSIYGYYEKRGQNGELGLADLVFYRR